MNKLSALFIALTLLVFAHEGVNHIGKNGGQVVALGALHCEVVLKPEGKYTIYFTDVRSEELPASTAAQVALTIKRPGADAETIAMQIGETGENWIGKGTPVKDPKTTVHASYSFHGKPFAADMPFFAPPPAAHKGTHTK
jgi:hypothetical protein